MSAMLASVSTLLDERRSGRRRPRSKGRGGTSVGLASPPLRKWTSADSSPATYRDGVATSSTEHAVGADAIGARASACSQRVDAPPRSSRSTQTSARSAPTACAAATAPSSTRCGAVSEEHGVLGAGRLALGAVGDHDSAAPARAARERRPRRARTAASLTAVGKPAPPRPRSPARPTSSTSGVRGRSGQRAEAVEVGGQSVGRRRSGHEPGQRGRRCRGHGARHRSLAAPAAWSEPTARPPRWRAAR